MGHLILKTAFLVSRLAKANPLVLMKMAKGFVKVNVFRQPQLRFVEIFVTLACNARCDFCSNGLFSSKKGNISHQKYIDIIDQCADLDVPVVGFIGGEPLLYPGLEELISYANKRGIMTILATNGTLLTEQRIAALAKAGLTNISISLHSLDESKHDSVYKIKGAYQTAFRAKDLCRKYKMSFQFAGVVGHSDFVDGTFEKLVSFVEREHIALNLNPLIPTGYAKDKTDNLLRPDDTRRLNEISRTSKYVSTHLTNNYFGFGCPAGNSYLGVNATGEIFPCFFFPISLGNIHTMTLREAWQKALGSSLFKHRHKVCYAGCDREFIDQYLLPIYGGGKVPMPIESHPKYSDADMLQDITRRD